MKELNLEVGQKVWSIQLGDCEVKEVNKTTRFPITCRGKDGRICGYILDGKEHENAFYRSLFESNPFDKPNDMVESKAEMINAFCFIIATNATSVNSKVIAQEKLDKILESL